MSDDSLREKINDLVARLPASFVYSLLSEIEGMDGEPSERVQLVRQYVIEYLNRQRTNRARRLFTTLFEAFMIDDDVLFHAGVSVPGMVQRVDVGALWEVMSRDAFPLLAVEAQEKLDDMARSEVIDRVLRSAAAMTLMERMRVAAVKHLDAVLATKKATDETLAAMSRNRPRRTRLLSAFLDKAPHIEAGTLQTMRDILAHAEGPAAMVAARLESFPVNSASAWERERMAEALMNATDDLAERLKDTPQIAVLLPLSVLNVKRNYAVTALYIRQSGIDPGRGNTITDALTAHFLATTRALTAALTAVLKLNERVPGSPIRPSVKEKARIEALMQRLGQLMEAVTASGMIEDRRSEPTFRNAWQAADKIMAVRVAGIAMERSAQAAVARRHGVVDHADVIWLDRLLWAWQDRARDFGYETYELVKWRETLLEEMRANVEKAMKFEDTETLDERMEHLLRINGISTVFGLRISRWIPTTSHNMVRLLCHRLEQAKTTVLAPEEWDIIDDLIATARTEVGKSRYWKSNELVDLIELSEKARQPG
ncbi:hypothetical protein [Azospirillum sp. sgz302134]